MENKFKVKVNNLFDFDFDQKQSESLDVIQQKNSYYHILHNSRVFRAELAQSDFDKKQYTVIVNSNTYQIKIKNPLDRFIEEIGYSMGSAKKLNLIHAPMPGIIIGIKVQEGDKVKEGDTLLILEAMKMENAINSSKDAVIKSIHAKTGDSVEKNKLLIELE
jgi:biotin carboxyl carrier protein